MREQCRILGLSRSSLYYQPIGISDRDRVLMNLLDQQYTRTPFYGVRNMRQYLQTLGYQVGKDHVRTLLRRMGLAAVFAKPNLSRPKPEYKIYPYLLKDVEITRPNQVWSADITYIRLDYGFAYLVAVLDWYSRYVLAWRLSTIPWTRYSAWKPWKNPLPSTAGRKSSTPTRAASLPAGSSPVC